MYSKRGYGDLSLGYNDINKTNVLEYFSDKNTDIKYVITGINFTLDKKSSLKKNIILNNTTLNKIKKKSLHSKSNSKNTKNLAGKIQANPIKKSGSKNNRKSNSKHKYNSTYTTDRPDKPNRLTRPTRPTRRPNSKTNSNPKRRSKKKIDMSEAFRFSTAKKKPKTNISHRLYSN